MLTSMLEGPLKFWNKDKGFGFVVTPKGDVFVHVTAAGDHLDDMRKEGAVITLEAGDKFVKDKFQLTATAVVKVTLLEERIVWASVRTFNEERMTATVYLGAIDLMALTAFVPRIVIEKSTVIPGVGMPMRAKITHTKDGWDVDSFETGPDILVEYNQYMEDLVRRGPEVEAAAAVDTVVTEPTPAAQPKQKLTRKPKPVRQPTLKETVAACAATAGSTAMAQAMAEAMAGAAMH